MCEADKVEIILREYENQNEWQRHNENQRAQLVNILLLITGGLVAIYSQSTTRGEVVDFVAWFLIGIGAFGVISITKYWERFTYHVDLETAHRLVLDRYIATGVVATVENEPKISDENVLLKTRKLGRWKHDSARKPILKDWYFMQHWIWDGVFAITSMLGVFLFWREHRIGWEVFGPSIAGIVVVLVVVACASGPRTPKERMDSEPNKATNTIATSAQPKTMA